MDENMRRIAVEDLAGSWLMKRIQSGEIPYRPGDPEPANVARGQIEAPIAVLPADLAEAIGAKSRVVRFSVATAQKQLEPEKGRLHFTPKDYEKAQKLIDRGEVLRADERTIVIQGVIDGAPWTIVIRRAESKPDEVRLVSLSRNPERRLKARREKGDIIRQGEEE